MRANGFGIRRVYVSSDDRAIDNLLQQARVFSMVYLSRRNHSTASPLVERHMMDNIQRRRKDFLLSQNRQAGWAKSTMRLCGL